MNTAAAPLPPAVRAVAEEIGPDGLREASAAFLDLLDSRLDAALSGDREAVHTLGGAAGMLGLEALHRTAVAAEVAGCGPPTAQLLREEAAAARWLLAAYLRAAGSPNR